MHMLTLLSGNLMCAAGNKSCVVFSLMGPPGRPNQIIAAISQKPSKKKFANKFTKKRVGCREAKRLEALDAVGAVPDDSERTMFRALAARAMYLSLDGPDIIFASKELCRDSAAPTKESVMRLKGLVRYDCQETQVGAEA